MGKIVIADAGPLIALAGVGQLKIFKELCSTIWITTSVKKECTIKAGKDIESILSALSEGWLKEEKFQYDLTHSEKNPPKSLGQGEIDTIEWGKQLAQGNISCLAIIDDRLARKYAHESGLNFIGTVRVLDIAEKKDLIDSAELLIEQISSNGYRISADILTVIRGN